MGRTAHPGHHAVGRRSLALATCLVAVSGGLAACSRPVSAEPTVVVSAEHALVHSAHAAVVAHPGQRLHPGDVVTVEDGGSVALGTAGRRTFLPSGAALAVIDGAHQELRRGTAVVDARRGPGAVLSTAGFTVRMAAGSAVRVDRGYTLRVATYSGRDAQVRSAAGRTLPVAKWFQVVAAGDALPSATAPLHLVDDTPEREVARALVTEDEQLNAQARGLDDSGSQSVRVQAAALKSTETAAPPGTPISETVLSVAIAKASGTSYGKVRTWRQEGGSWAVVARIAGAGLERTLAAISRLEPGASMSAPQALAALRSFVQAATSAGGGGQPGRIGESPGAGAGGSGSTRSGGAGGGGRPTPTPSPSDGGLVGQVVDTVSQVLPSPSAPAPAPSSTPTQQGLAIVPLPAPVQPG